MSRSPAAPGAGDRAAQASRSCRHGATDADDELQRLLRVEAELEVAIAECKSALDEVRRELRSRDVRPPPLAH